jgi:hypothetical protein
MSGIATHTLPFAPDPGTATLCHLHDPERGVDRVRVTITRSLDEGPTVTMEGPTLPRLDLCPFTPWEARLVLDMIAEASGSDGLLGRLADELAGPVQSLGEIAAMHASRLCAHPRGCATPSAESASDDRR